jgi:hypothetical protein
MLRGLHARSVSNEKRLTSEQTLVSLKASFRKASLPAAANMSSQALQHDIST